MVRFRHGVSLAQRGRRDLLRGVAVLLAVGICAACGSSHAARRHPIHIRNTYLGLACRHGYPCSRLGIAVWLSAPALRVTVDLDGRRVSLATRRNDQYRRYWQAFVHDTHAERIAGEMNHPLRVTIAATRPGGARKRAKVETAVLPGWG